MAVFVVSRVKMTTATFVEYRGLLKAGHAAHPQCLGSAMSISELIRDAEAILPGTPAAEGADDPRWQAIIAIGEYIETHPDDVWPFVARWGVSTQADLRDAIATCLLEHLLQHHFELIFPRIEQLAKTDRMFADTLSRCWKFGQAEAAENAKRFDALLAWCSSRRGA